MAYVDSTYLITLTAGGGTENLPVTDPYGEYDIVGSPTLAGSWVIQASGSPVTNTKFIFNYEANVTLNGNNLTIFGLSLTDEQALKHCIIVSKYDGSAWDTKIFPDFEQSDIIATSHIIDDAVDKDKIAADVAGSGLGQNVDGSLEVNVDNSTLEINADTLRAKAAGITESHLNTSVAGSGLAGGGGTALSVNVDASTIEIAGDTLRVKDAGITNAKLANMADQTVKANVSGGAAAPSDVSISTLINDNSWGLSGNSGTTAGTNFIGTTDAVDLVFKVNNVLAGRIDLSDDNTSYGLRSLESKVSGILNVAIGKYSLGDLTNGEENSATGIESLVNLTTGGRNSGFGYNSGNAIITGSYNTLLGAESNTNSNASQYRIALGYNALADTDYQFALPDNVDYFKFRGNSFELPSADGSANAALVTDGSGVLSFGSVITSGTYTPTLTNVTNITASTAYPCQYMRVGNTVTVSGQVAITTTANTTQTTFGMSLPIASNFGNTYECGGGGYTQSNSAAGHGICISADAANNRANFDYYETHGAADTFNFSFTYQII